ncbi:TRAP transporter large permease subunit [Pseudooceanicola sediminis]|uniref:TRAP transporter large permease subunit n=1 Tax=Pseudooceanicola sediminis TaxID=2211117 RepID=A0A399J197_9RHOB|nr:TRAP transporter large permease subunit [Pseudooceanicola sediminis]KAA2315168.1 TRAP transporter large permease subunit [Puniceibacterium sp. HSS470]RII39024.1 TRAP transporter large permease subunit [Pseudooceanicola sediminis]|tara:strand:+ start:4850 stop:6175 length:1326 start_codon:yes stop_codon:yes gene_type:complete
MSYELIALLMFSSMMLMLLTGQRVFGAIGFVAVVAALCLWGDKGGYDLGYGALMKLMKWYPMLTLPMFVFMGYVLSESKIADDLYRMFHVWMGGIRGGLAIGTIGLMVLVSAMNGLSVAGMAIGSTIALPELLKRGYDKKMVTGVIQAGSSLGILVPPSVVLVLYAMIARQPVGQLWLAGIGPGFLMAGMFILYIVIRCALNPALGPALSAEDRDIPMAEKLRLLWAGTLPLGIFLVMMVPFVMGYTSLVEASAIGALAAFTAALLKGRMSWRVFETATRQTLAISCMFMWIILAALAFGAVFDGLGAVKAIENLFTEKLGLSPWMILILMQLSFLVMGSFLDDTAMLVIVAPLYVPLVGALGFDLVWYGVLYTITCQIAYMTPPFGYNLFLMRAMAPPEITLRDIYGSIFPFVAVMILALIVVMVFPGIATWLPDTVYAK